MSVAFKSHGSALGTPENGHQEARIKASAIANSVGNGIGTCLVFGPFLQICVDVDPISLDGEITVSVLSVQVARVHIDRGNPCAGIDINPTIGLVGAQLKLEFCYNFDMNCITMNGKAGFEFLFQDLSLEFNNQKLLCF